MTTVVEALAEFRARDKRELAMSGIRNLASNKTDFAMYGLVTLVLMFAAINSLLLLQVAGYTAASLQPVLGVFKGGFYFFLGWMALAVGKILAGVAVDHWDGEEVTTDG